MINQISTFSSPALFSVLSGIAARHKLRRGSGRYVGQCPQCGGSARTDRFVIQDDGGFKCYSCNFKGDIITWLRVVEGKSCAEAHEELGAQCRSTSCATKGSCRMGAGSGKRTQRAQRQSLQPRPGRAVSTIGAGAIKDPDAVWQSWAVEMVEKSALVLQAQPTIISYLISRGISEEAILRFKLGYLSHDRQVCRADIGLPAKEGKEKLWIPGGLLIPIFDAGGNVHRLRVRRTKEAMERFLPERKYVWIEGSGSAPLVIAPSVRESRGAVIVEAELDAMAVATAHDQVAVVALGTVQGGVPEGLRRNLEQQPAILVALDADAGGSGAGPKAVKAWLRTFRQARFWPVPEAKDAGDYARLGGNLWTWIEAGLPHQVGVEHDSGFSPDSSLQGKGGEQQKVEEQGIPTVRVMTLVDGREVYMVDDEGEWRRLTDEGKIVFTGNELSRLKDACAKMSDEERRRFVLSVCDAKESFSGAWIKAGREVAAAPQ